MVRRSLFLVLVATLVLGPAAASAAPPTVAELVAALKDCESLETCTASQALIKRGPAIWPAVGVGLESPDDFVILVASANVSPIMTYGNPQCPLTRVGTRPENAAELESGRQNTYHGVRIVIERYGPPQDERIRSELPPPHLVGQNGKPLGRCSVLTGEKDASYLRPHAEHMEQGAAGKTDC